MSENKGMTVREMLHVLHGLVEEGEGDREVIFTDVDGPELWAVTSEVADNVPGMLAIGDVATALVERTPPRRYVVQYRDAADYRWRDLEDHRYDVLGEALTACDVLIEDEEVFLPRNRHRVVDLHDGAIVVWKCRALARP